jgi:hypothetical protein
MSGFYEVTTASGCGGGRRVHEKAPVWAGCCVSHPVADRTLTGASDATAPSPSPLALRARYEGDGPTALTESAGTAKLHSCRTNSEGLIESVVRVGSKNPKVVAWPRRALLGLGAPSTFHGRHSECRTGSRRWLCATATVRCERYRASAFAYSEVLRIARTVTFGVKDFPVIARRWAEAGQAHASSAGVVGINHDKFGAILDTITRELAARRDRATGSLSRCSVPGLRRGRRCSRQFAVGREGLLQVTRELVAPSAYFPSIPSGFSAHFPPIGRTKVGKSLQTVAAPVRPCPPLAGRIFSAGLGCPLLTVF